jgi:hypothetical protein
MHRQSMRYATGFLLRWLIHSEQFDCWVNVLADNDNLAPAGAEPQHETLPAVSLLSFY